MLIIDSNFHHKIVQTYHNYLLDPVEVDLNPDEYVERQDYVSASSLGRCPKAYAMQKRNITPKFPELNQDNNLAALMRMRGGTEAGITFAKAMKSAFPDNVIAEKYLQDEILKIHGFADVIINDDIGQTAIIEVKKRSGYASSPAAPRISDIYQMLTYGLIYKCRNINARMYLVLVDGSETYPLHVYELAEQNGGFELRDLFHSLVNDFTGEIIQPYTVWEHDINSPMYLNYYEITGKLNTVHEWLSKEVFTDEDCPIPDPVNSKTGYQCIKWEGGSKPRPNKIKPSTGVICAACPFSCHFNSSVEKRTVLIYPDGHGEISNSIDI